MLHKEKVVVALAVERAVVATRHIVEEIVPIGLARELLQPVLVEPRRVQAADDGAHARSRDVVDRHAEFAEREQHADMGAAASAASR